MSDLPQPLAPEYLKMEEDQEKTLKEDIFTALKIFALIGVLGVIWLLSYALSFRNTAD